MRLRGYIFRAIIAIALFAMQWGCAAPPRSATITIGVRTANDHAPFYLADQKQLYRQAGLAVTVRVVPSNTEIVEALQRGDFQMAALPVTTAIAAIASGAPLHIVAMTGRGSDGLLVRQADNLAGITSLKGKKIATVRASILEVLLRYSLKQAGLDPERDVQLVYMAKLGDLISALKTGQVDACSNTEPYMTDAARQGWGRILMYYTADWPGHPCCVVVARDDLIQRNPKALRTILGIHCDTVGWANAHLDETAQSIVDYLQAFDRPLVRDSLDRSKMLIDCCLQPEEIQRMADLMAQQGLIERVPPLSRLVNMEPLQGVSQGCP